MALQQGEKTYPYPQSRDELKILLENKMRHSYQDLVDRGRVEEGNSFLKSFLLECDWKPQDWDRAQEGKYLCDLFSIRPEGRKKLDIPANIVQADEAGFYIINWERNEEKTTLYLDTVSDPTRRFWRAYSVDSAKPLNAVMDRVTASNVYLDRIWAWSNLLKDIQHEGEPRGFRFEHNNVFSENKEEINSLFSLRFSPENKGESERLLELISTEPMLARKTSLANVRMKYFETSSSKDFSIETLYFDGRITTNGTSFKAHENLIENLESTYSNKVRELENDYIIRASGSVSGWHLEGDPIVFDFSETQISDMDIFCDTVFSGKPPFQLWGTPRPTFNEEGRTVVAVDMHNGAKMFFEIYPDIICMYLSIGACGNSAVRFYTNIQRTFSRLVEAKNDSGSRLF